LQETSLTVQYSSIIISHTYGNSQLATRNSQLATKGGFTLIELSIGLVIIGLLISGILAGQSLIEAAKINKVVHQLRQYDIAISNFRSKYNQYPGDSNIFPSPGNNDKMIINREVGAAWHHLFVGVGLKNKYGSSPQVFDQNAPTTKENCPLLDLEQDKRQTRCLAIVSDYSNPAANLSYRYFEGPLLAPPRYAPILPKDLLAIDQKTDNGLANSGFVRSGYWGSLGTNICNNGATYLVANSFGCIPIIRIGSLNNDTNK
jgi:prepilin-type N-terminal cleavage/methylation domain-containing protein